MEFLDEILLALAVSVLVFFKLKEKLSIEEEQYDLELCIKQNEIDKKQLFNITLLKVYLPNLKIKYSNVIDSKEIDRCTETAFLHMKDSDELIRYLIHKDLELTGVSYVEENDIEYLYSMFFINNKGLETVKNDLSSIDIVLNKNVEMMSKELEEINFYRDDIDYIKTRSEKEFVGEKVILKLNTNYRPSIVHLVKEEKEFDYITDIKFRDLRVIIG
jgi:hypothetical protein